MGDLQWILKIQDTARAAELARALGVSPLLGQLLLNRGITDLDTAKIFLSGDLDSLADPHLMKDMDRAVERVERALHRGEPIVIYGDYDVDGQTASTLLVSVLRELSSDPDQVGFYIPNRIDEGYGLNEDALHYLAGKAKLVITVDCGIASLREAALAKELGLDMIITDHHQPGPDLPDAVAVLNPKRPDCSYPEKQLAGVGVAFRLAQAIGQRHGRNFHEYLDLVALGTVADLVPLLGENRILAKRGLETMNSNPRCGIQALIEVAGISSKVSAGDLGFRLGPRLNAAGRMSDPAMAVKLLLSEDPVYARELAKTLDEENAHRQDVEKRITEEAKEAILSSNAHQASGIVVAGRDWHPGVIGIVASRLVEEFYRPTIVISLSNGVGTGSARSITGFSMYDALVQCSHLLDRFGGHTMAAGLTVQESNLGDFTNQFVRLCDETLTPELLRPKLRIDAEVTLDGVTEALVEELALLEPTGLGNPAPVLKAGGSIVQWRVVGRQANHLSFTLKDETNRERRAIAFGLAEQASSFVSCQDNVDVAFVPVINEWRDQRSVQLQVKALTSGTGSDDCIRRMMGDYPWKLAPEYARSPYLEAALNNVLLSSGREADSKTVNVVDLRGTWNKIQAFQERSQDQKRVLILVNTALEAQELCREMRINFPQRREKIGVIHHLLSPEELEECARLDLEWVVSTGQGAPFQYDWEAVWLWKPPLTKDNLASWIRFARGATPLVLAFGPNDVRQLELALTETLPDRRGLARVYSVLRQRAVGGAIPLDAALEDLEKLGIETALWFAQLVFSELNLWYVDGTGISFRPAPAKKLDLHQAVLYNRGMNIRRQSSFYLKECLQRGFMENGLKAEN